jgi:nitric oxide reductase NorQ protein
MATATAARKTAAPKKGAAESPLLKHVDLKHLIPEQRFSEEYFSRKIEGVWDIDLLRYAKLAGNNILLFGPTGPGKTSLILAYGAVDKIAVVTVQCNGAIDPNTFWGGWQPDPADPEGRRLIWVDSEITEVIRQGGILYLDEVNFLPPKVAAVFHGLLDKRRQITIPEKGNEVIKAHSDLQVICAYNPDYEGTKPLNAAFKNRFKLKLRFDYDEAVEKELICIPVMLDIAKKLRLAQKNGDLDTPVSTNMLVEFEELAVDLGYEFAMTNFLNAFADEERQAVTEAFDMFRDEIRKQVAEMERLAATS